jgi:dihydroxy-acid dehydratase
MSASGNGHLDPKHNSRPLTDGPHRAPARAYLKGIGYDDEALAKPIIGVASTWIETMPCNYHLRALAAKVKEGIRAAGGRRWSSTRSRSPTGSPWAPAGCARASSPAR